MKIFKFLPLFLLFILTANSGAQYMAGPKMSGIGLPYFQIGIFRTFDEKGTVRIVRLFIQILNDDLTFIKEDELFKAGIEYEVFIQDENKQNVYNKNVTEEITTPSFEETNSRTIQHTFQSDIPLSAGDFDAIITVLDKNSGKQVNRKINFKVEDLQTDEFLLSDILYFTDYEMDSTNRIVRFNPNLTGNFSGSDKYIYFYFTSVVSDTTDTLYIQYTVRDNSRAISQINQYALSHEPAFQEHFIRLNRHQFDQSRYELEVIGKYRNKTKTNRRLFTFFWTISPDSPRDLELALEQMRYIIEADSIDWALKQPFEVRKAYFDRFWKRMDPNPNTKKNELLDEFFRRVNLANATFSTISMEGWKTDRGRIFIKFGEPDDIERHPFEINTFPYEIWRYYNLRKTFLFIDRTGFGDYYLHPNYIDEEYN
ncbi:MAG: hypothetical protein Kow0042_13930 [Calditrichia bacterium]